MAADYVACPSANSTPFPQPMQRDLPRRTARIPPAAAQSTREKMAIDTGRTRVNRQDFLT